MKSPSWERVLVQSLGNEKASVQDLSTRLSQCRPNEGARVAAVGLQTIPKCCSTSSLATITQCNALYFDGPHLPF